MRRSKLQRIIAMILMIIMIIPTNAVTTLAAGGADADTSTDGIGSPSGSGGGSSYGTVIHRTGGGYKISFMSLPLDTYNPEKTQDKRIDPIYTDNIEEGKTPISVIGTNVINNHSGGLYGIAPIYLVGGWSDKNEYGIDTSFKFDKQADAINGKQITENVLKKAIALAGDKVKDKNIYKDIYNAFNQTNIFDSTKDINTALKMVRNATDEADKTRNNDIITTLIYAAVICYDKTSDMGKYLLKLSETNMSEQEVILLIEPMAHINIKGKGSGYITPANFVFGATKVTPSEYVNTATYTELRKLINSKGGFNGVYQSTCGLYSGAGGYIMGMSKDGVYTTAIGSGLGGHNAEPIDPIKYRESLFGKVIYSGPLNWVGDEVNYSNTGYKWGFGCLASSDFLDEVIEHDVTRISAVSISTLGQQTSLAPAISMTLANRNSMEDETLNAKVREAINGLDEFAVKSGMTLEKLEDYLTSDSCLDILKILIREFSDSTLETTSFAGKQETLNGKLKDVLTSSGLDLDSVYVAKYINMLLKNGTVDENGSFTFNTDANRRYIRYLYTLFDDDIASGYKILSNIEAAYRDLEPEEVGNEILFSTSSASLVGTKGSNTFSNVMNYSKISDSTAKRNIKIFDGLDVTIVTNITNKDFLKLTKNEPLVTDSVVNEKTPEQIAYENKNELMEYASKLHQLRSDLSRIELIYELNLSTARWDIALEDYATYKRIYPDSTINKAKQYNEKKSELEKVIAKLGVFDTVFSSSPKYNSVLTNAEELQKLNIEFTGDNKLGVIGRYVNNIDKERKYFGEIGFVVEYTTKFYNEYKKIRADFASVYNLDEKLQAYYDTVTNSGYSIGDAKTNWIKELPYVAELASIALYDIANTLGIDIKVKVDSEFKMANGGEDDDDDIFILSDSNVGSNLDWRIADIDAAVTKRISTEDQLKSPSVDMSNRLTSLSSSMYISDYSKLSINLPKVKSSNEVTARFYTNTKSGIGVSTESINTLVQDSPVYYSPIIYSTADLLNAGFYGTLDTSHYAKDGKISINLDTLDLTALAEMAELGTLTENEVLQNTLNTPNGGLTAMSDEIQVLLSDYINDCINYSKWYWSDENKEKNKSADTLNKRFNNELQYRVGMYLDIIKDIRGGVRYINMVTNKDNSNIINIGGDLELTAYDYIIYRTSNYYDIGLSSYYDNQVGEENVYSKVIGQLNVLDGIDGEAIEELLFDDNGSFMYNHSAFGTTLAYLSNRTYKFNRSMITESSTRDIALYVGGAFQYPISYVACDPDYSTFGADLKLGETYTYSIYSIPLNTKQNTDYFRRVWPVNGSTNLGKENGVYIIGDILLQLLKQGKKNGFPKLYLTETSTTPSYVIVDGTVSSNDIHDGRVATVIETVSTVLGISKAELSTFYNTYKGTGKYELGASAYTLQTLIAFLDRPAGDNYPGLKVVHTYLSEEMLALTQYLFENMPESALDEIDNTGVLNNLLNGFTVANIMTGNGALANTLRSIQMATTNDIAYSWWAGLGVKLGSPNIYSTDTSAQISAKILRADEQLKAYMTVLSSMLSGLGYNKSGKREGFNYSDGKYDNKRPLVEYVQDSISYGEKNGSAAGGLTVSNDVFTYYIENIIALSSLTKTQTAVYVADDGEVSDTSFATSIGNTVARIDYLSNIKAKYSEDIKDIENKIKNTEADETYQKLSKLQSDIQKVEDEIQALLKSVDEDFINKYLDAYDKKEELHKKMQTALKEYNNAKAKYEDLDKKTKEYDKKQEELLSEQKTLYMQLPLYQTKLTNYIKAGNKTYSSTNKNRSISMNDIMVMVTDKKATEKYTITEFNIFKNAIEAYKEYSACMDRLLVLAKELSEIDNWKKVNNWSVLYNLKLEMQHKETLYNKATQKYEDAKKAYDNMRAQADLEVDRAKKINDYGEKREELQKKQKKLQAEYNSIVSVYGDLVKKVDSMKKLISQLENAMRVTREVNGKKLLIYSLDQYIAENAYEVSIKSYDDYGNYIFNLTNWEYEDADSGAVLYLPGNANAILNPAILGEKTSTLNDNKDDRISSATNMKAYGTTVLGVASSMDAIASTALQENATNSTGVYLYNFMYSNGSWPFQAIMNNKDSVIRSTNIVFDQDIPIDAQIILVDNNGTVLEYKELIKNFTSIPSNVVSSIDIAETFSLADIDVEVQHIAMVPAAKNGDTYEIPNGVGQNILKTLKQKDPSSVNILDGTGITDIVSYLQDLENITYNYNASEGYKTIRGQYLAAVTEYDRQLYSADNRAHPIMILLVKIKEPIKQINVIENYNDTTQIKEVQPVTNDAETEVYLNSKVTVKNSAGNGVGTLKEWVVLKKEDAPASISTWSDIPISKAVASGTGTTVKPIEGGQTVYVRYHEGAVVPLSGDLTLEQNEITKKYALSSYDNGNLEMLSQISAVNGTHSHDLGSWVSHTHTSSCPENCSASGYWSSDWRYFSYSYRLDNTYEHKYMVLNVLDIDEKLMAKSTDAKFSPVLKNFTTGSKTVSYTGNSNITVSPDYEFVLWRGYDIPTLASFKNSDTVKNELALLGVQSGVKPNKRIIDSGLQDNKYELNIKIGIDSTGDYSTSFACSYCMSSSKVQNHDLPDDKEHKADAVVRTYTGTENDIGDEKSSNNTSLSFSSDGKNFTSALGFSIPNRDNISFYPYVEMTYDTMSSTGNKAYVLSTTLSKLNVSDYVDIGYSKTAALTLKIDSKQWSNHRRSLNFISNLGLSGRDWVLPGGATYTLDNNNQHVYVGFRTWQTVLPSNTINYVQSGDAYFNAADAADRREALRKQIKENLENYDIVQYVAKGIFTEAKDVVSNGVLLDKIASGTSQKVYGEQLSKDDKYYLKLKTPLDSKEVDDADLDVISDNQVRQVTYTIKSDTAGNVWVERDGTSIASINKTQGLAQLLANSEVKELDDKTKLVTNYLTAIDRNKGDVGGDKWYNEAWDGISVVLTEYIMEVGFNTPKARSSALDVKLVGKIDSKADIYNFEDANKVRTSIFRTAINNSKNGKARWVANWGGVDITLKNIENMFVSKPFYIPNATVNDLN